MHEFQITRKQLQVILARSSIIQAQSVVVFCFGERVVMFLGNFRTANSLEHFIRVKLFLKYQQFRLVDSSLQEMSTKTDKVRKSRGISTSNLLFLG